MRATVAPRPPVGVSTGIAWSRGSRTVFEHAVPGSRRASSVIARWSLFASASRSHGRPQRPKLAAVRGGSARSGRASCPINRGGADATAPYAAMRDGAPIALDPSAGRAGWGGAGTRCGGRRKTTKRRRIMTWRAWCVVAVVAGARGLPSVVRAQSEVAATLSVLAAPVERIPAGASAPEPGVNGMNLADGDRIKTGVGGVALITFLNGSTVTVMPSSEVTVKQTSSERATSGMRLFIHAGRVWARVVQAAVSRSVLTLESNDYSATARDGLIGAERSPEGFGCWTRRGLMTITNRVGQNEAVLMAGQRVWARQGWPVTPEPLVAGASTLEIESSRPVVPFLRMPDGRVAARLLAPGVAGS